MIHAINRQHYGESYGVYEKRYTIATYAAAFADAYYKEAKSCYGKYHHYNLHVKIQYAMRQYRRPKWNRREGHYDYFYEMRMREKTSLYYDFRENIKNKDKFGKTDKNGKLLKNYTNPLYYYYKEE